MEESLSRSKSQVSTSSYRRKKVIRRESVNRIESSSSSIMLNSKDMLFSLSTPMLRSRVGELADSNVTDMLKSSVAGDLAESKQQPEIHKSKRTPRYRATSVSSILTDKYLGSRSGSRVSRASAPEQSKGEQSNDQFNEDLALSKTDGARQLNYSIATPQMKKQRLDYLKNIQQKYTTLGFNRSDYALKLQQQKEQQKLLKPRPRQRYDRSLDQNVQILTEKLHKIIDENKALQAKLFYVKDEDSCYKRAAEVKILEQEIKEAQQKYQTLLKAQNVAMQAQEEVKKMRVDGVDLAPELQVESDVAYERLDKMTAQLKQAEEQLQIYSSVENLVLKYIPSHYYLLLKDVQNVERLVKDFRAMQQRAGENSAKARLQKLNLTSEDINNEIQLLYKDINEGKKQIAEERERHLQEMTTINKELKEEETILIKLSNDYNLLLQDFQSRVKYIKLSELGLDNY